MKKSVCIAALLCLLMPLQARASIAKCGTATKAYVNGNTTLAVNAPTGCSAASQAVALFIVGFNYAVGPSITTPAGFTASTGTPFASGSFVVMSIFCQIIASGGTIPSSTTVTFASGIAGLFSYAVTGYSGTCTTIFDGTPVLTSNGSGGATIPAGGLTTASNGDMIVDAFSCGDHGVCDEGAGTTFADSPAGSTVEVNINRGDTSSTSYAALADWVQTSAGATGTDTLSGMVTNPTGDATSPRTGLTFGLKTAAAAATAKGRVVLLP